MDKDGLKFLIKVLVENNGSIPRFAAELNKLNGSLQKIGRSVMLLKNGFANLKSVITNITGVVKSFYDIFNKLGKTFNTLQMSALGSSNSFTKLKTVYDSLGSSGRKLNISVQDVAGGISRLQQSSVLLNKEMQNTNNIKYYIKSIDQLSNVMDSGEAVDAFQEAINNIDPDRIAEFPEILKQIAESKSTEELNAAQNALNRISRDANLTIPLFNSLNASLHPESLPPLINGWQELQKVINQVKAAIGNKLAEVYSQNQTKIKALLDTLLEKLPLLFTAAEPFINAMLSSLPLMVSGLGTLLDKGSALLGWFNSFNDTAKTGIALTVLFAGSITKLALSLLQLGGGFAMGATGISGLLGKGGKGGKGGLSALRVGARLSSFAAANPVAAVTGGLIAADIAGAAYAAYQAHELHQDKKLLKSANIRTNNQHLEAIKSSNKTTGIAKDRNFIKNQIYQTSMDLDAAKSKWFNGEEVSKLKDKLTQLQDKYNSLQTTEEKNIEYHDRVSESLKTEEKQTEATKLSVIDLVIETSKLTNLTGKFKNLISANTALTSALDVLGPTAKFAGSTVGEVLTQKSVNLYSEASKNIEQYKVHLQQAIDAGDVQKVQEYSAAIQEAFKQMPELAKQAIAPIERINSELELQKGLQQESLRISQSLYGTPALAVEAQMEIVNTIEQQIKAKERELAITRKMMQESGRSEAELYQLRMQGKQEEKDILSLKAEQVETVKSLRDGYLDAVKEESLGFGRFSKIIITQKKGIMLALDSGMAKKNYLLGQAGVKTGAQAYKYSGGPVFNPLSASGGLKHLDGSSLTPEELRERQSKIPDSISRQVLGGNLSNINFDNKFRSSAALLGIPEGSPAGTTAVGEKINNSSSPINTSSSKNASSNAAAALRAAADNIEKMGKNFDTFVGDGMNSGVDISNGARFRSHA